MLQHLSVLRELYCTVLYCTDVRTDNNDGSTVSANRNASIFSTDSTTCTVILLTELLVQLVLTVLEELVVFKVKTY